MSAWSMDILRKRDGKLTIFVSTGPSGPVDSEEISSTARLHVVPAIHRLARRLGRPEVIHTDHAQVWHGLPAIVGAAHRTCLPSEQSRLSLLERRFRAEDRP